MVADQPLLEAFQITNGRLTLLLYRQKNITRALQSAPALGDPITWRTDRMITLTNLSHVIEPAGASNRSLFFRLMRP